MNTTSFITLDDMAAAMFALGVERLSQSWQLSIGLMLGAIIIKFAKGIAIKYNVPVSLAQ